DLLHDHPGLAAARAGEHEHGAFDVGDGGGLLGVEAVHRGTAWSGRAFYPPGGVRRPRPGPGSARPAGRRARTVESPDGQAVLLLLGDERGEDHDPAAVGAQLPRARDADPDPGPEA